MNKLGTTRGFGYMHVTCIDGLTDSTWGFL